MTKKENFETIKGVLVENGYVELADVMDNEIATLDKRTEAEKARAAKRKEVGDELRAIVFDTLDTEIAKSNVDIMKEINDDDITPAIITARLTQLCNTGKAKKEKIKTEKGSKTVYTKVID